MKNNLKPRIPFIAIIVVVITLFTLVACGKENRCRVPIGEASCQIDPNSPLYPGLNIVGGYEYLVGGANGIVVARTGLSDFVCYERSCPFDTGRIEMVAGWDNAILECPKCHSQFMTEYGSPVDGSKTSCSLNPYRADYYNGILYISNF